jgi:hypothetical protein
MDKVDDGTGTVKLPAGTKVEFVKQPKPSPLDAHFSAMEDRGTAQIHLRSAYYELTDLRNALDHKGAIEGAPETARMIAKALRLLARQIEKRAA